MASFQLNKHTKKSLEIISNSKQNPVTASQNPWKNFCLKFKVIFLLWLGQLNVRCFKIANFHLDDNNWQPKLTIHKKFKEKASV